MLVLEPSYCYSCITDILFHPRALLPIFYSYSQLLALDPPYVATLTDVCTCFNVFEHQTIYCQFVVLLHPTEHLLHLST